MPAAVPVIGDDRQHIHTIEPIRRLVQQAPPPQKKTARLLQRRRPYLVVVGAEAADRIEEGLRVEAEAVLPECEGHEEGRLLQLWGHEKKEGVAKGV